MKNFFYFWVVALATFLVVSTQMITPQGVEAASKEKKACSATRWTKIFSVDNDGTILSGSYGNLYQATYDGCDLKVVMKQEGQFGGLTSFECSIANAGLPVGAGLETFFCSQGRTIAWETVDGNTLYSSKTFGFSNFTGQNEVSYMDISSQDESMEEDAVERTWIIYARH